MRMASSLRIRLFSTAMIAAGCATVASAQDMVASAEQQGQAAKVELIDSSRLGCGQGKPMWTTSGGGTQCAFDSATRGARIAAREETSFGSIETYATVAHTTTGAFTPDQLLAPASSRQSVATDFFMVGFKGTAFDNRLKLTAEFARTDRVVDELIQRDWALADTTSRGGSSAMVRLDAKLIDKPGLQWSLSGEYRSVSDDYSVGRSSDLFRYFALPGTRLALSTKARVGQLGLNAGIEEVDNFFGTSSTRKAGLDFQGVTLSLRSRDSSVNPMEGSTLIDGRTHSDNAYLSIDSEALAAWLLPEVDELPWLVPATVSVGVASGATENRYLASTELYSRSSLGIDGTWDTPLGETSLSYWRDTRTWVSGDARSRFNETLTADHLVRFGNWRLGLDVSLSRMSSDGANSFDEQSLSFGQSIAYSITDGPQLRISLGQDRGQMRTDGDSYASADRYSSVTASLDLSKYLQKRFERDDLRLTFDYRKTVDSSEAEFSLYDELVDRWIDSDRREGFLMSFGMKL
jgi:hypothetical protein